MFLPFAIKRVFQVNSGDFKLNSVHTGNNNLTGDVIWDYYIGTFDLVYANFLFQQKFK